MSDLNFSDALSMAVGCKDYGGGYHGEEWEIYQHGIQTVINVLTKANKNGIDGNLQLQIVKSIGAKELENKEVK
jgi:hypothetical protein